MKNSFTDLNNKFNILIFLKGSFVVYDIYNLTD